MPEAQRTMFGMFDDPVAAVDCKHLVEFETFTTRPGDVERLTWTCEACGNIRGRTTVGVKPLTHAQWLKRTGREK